MKSLLRIPACFVLLVLCALALESCGKPDTVAPETELNPSGAPVSELGAAINNYQKIATEYVHVAKKHKNGDVSVTMSYLDLREQTRAAAAKVQQKAGEMTPAQRKRVALIAAKTAPFPLD